MVTENMATLLWSSVEILRSLYHIDIIRQNFRILQHKCNAASIGPCTTCEIKELFGKLSETMRNPGVNPQYLASVIAKTHVLSKLSMLNLNNTGQQALYNGVLSLLPRDLNLRAEYSLTKICLSCSTYSHTETVEKFAHRIECVDSAILPSFEFGLKSSLDSNEFCDKAGCFGALRIFRVLKRMPNLITLEFENMYTSQLPLNLKPCLIFESPASNDLTLTCITLNPPATLFYHTRLHLWIFSDPNSVSSIASYEQVQTLNFRVSIAFYTKFAAPPFPNPQPPPLEPRITIDTSRRSSPPHPTPPLQLPDTRIYENWPLDSDSGQGSEVTSSLSECIPQTTPNHSETKYATIKRKKKKGIPPAPLSVSVPDLRHLLDSKKVSFDSQVTLVDEGEEEYIPHPILQKILAQLSALQQHPSSNPISPLIS